MKKNIKYCLLLLLPFLFTSCNKWLEVQPEDRFTEEQVFSTSQGFEDAVNGVYISLGKSSLYGSNLTLSTTEILAQRFKVNSNHNYKEYIAYNYSNAGVKNNLSTIWNDAYLNIANINQLVINVDRFGEKLNPARAKQIKGEMIGLRAFLHFDLLRLFGPIYDSSDSTDLSIPYYAKVSASIQNFEPANQIMNKIQNDLKEAETLLADDPVRNQGSTNLNSYRFNYFVVKALQARVFLWRKDKAAALNAAKTVIAASSLFPWITAANITGDNQNPDRIFSTELLFAAFTNQLYTYYDNLYYFELQEGAILSVGSSTFLNQIFENYSNDYRKDYTWKVPPLGSPFPTFFKYADVVDKKTKMFRNTIPLVRLSELYYIAAETEPDNTQALAYLNEVRNHRGIPSLVNPASTSEEILKEYRKEFYGEGQMWFYYKRNKISKVISPNNDNGVDIPASAWVFPIPDEEMANR